MIQTTAITVINRIKHVCFGLTICVCRTDDKDHEAFRHDYPLQFRNHLNNKIYMYMPIIGVVISSERQIISGIAEIISTSSVRVIIPIFYQIKTQLFLSATMHQCWSVICISKLKVTMACWLVYDIIHSHRCYPGTLAMCFDMYIHQMYNSITCKIRNR